MGVIRTKDVASELHDNTFWENVVPNKPNKEGGEAWCGAVGTVELSAHEKVAVEMFLDSPSRQIPTTQPNDEVYSTNDSVCDDLSVGSVETMNRGRTRIEEFDDLANDMGNMMVAVGSSIDDAVSSKNLPKSPSPVKLNTTVAQSEALQKLGSVQRNELNDQCLIDQFTSGAAQMKDIVREREKDIAKEKRRVQLIYDSVTYFKTKKSSDMASLDAVIDAVSSIDCDLLAVPIPI